MKRGQLSGLIVVLAVLAPAVRAEEPKPQTWPELRAQTVTQLHELAAWCRRAKLYGRRAEVYQRVLRIAPEDVDAHKGLKHRRGDDGTWHANPAKRKPRNLRRDTGEFATRLEEVIDAFEAAARAFVAEDAPRAKFSRLRQYCYN